MFTDEYHVKLNYVNFLHRGGYKSGLCSAGYFCLAGSEQYTPTGDPPNYLEHLGNWTCDPALPCAGPCPAGRYCPEGTTDPLPCPEHTLNRDVGARMVNDCLPCPAGYWCWEGMYETLNHANKQTQTQVINYTELYELTNFLS